MHYDVHGAGDNTIIFIHGFGGFGGLWRWQVDHFKSRVRVITVDLPGHGRTPWRGEGLDAMADQAREILEGLSVRQAHVVASSFGGLVALKFWERSPGRMKSLCLVGSLPRFTRAEDFPAGLDVKGIRRLKSQFDGDVGKVLDMFVRSFSTADERLSAQYARVKELRKIAPLPDREALKAFLDILETADLRPILRRVDIPLHVVSGDGDYICPPVAINALCREVPQAKADILMGAGHGLFLTRPDDFNRVLAEFTGL
ncbi:MAG: alpha/beta fold hydrolase [Candidatus Omnitrophica bacterium]|nr:alpha/beta fold hydrolase [Candidatus Omnitrophota bacterium]